VEGEVVMEKDIEDECPRRSSRRRTAAATFLPCGAKQVQKDGRPQGADKRRGTPRAKNEQTTGDDGGN
jgi:hypothetical protein